MGERKLKNKSLFKKILVLTMMTIMVLSSTMTAFAGTSGTIGSSSGGGGGNGGSSDVYKIGPSYSNGVRWSAVHSGNVNWSTDVPYANKYGGSSFTAPAYKWMCIQKHSHSKGWFNFRWQWWFSCAGMSTLRKTIDEGYYSEPWVGGYSIKDADLAKEAAAGGYSFNTSRWSWNNGSNDLDIVWASGWKETKTDTRMTIVYAEIADPSGGNKSVIQNDVSGNSAQWLYDNQIKTLRYNGKSLETEMNHDRIVKATYIPVTKTTTYMTDGSRVWDQSVTYKKGVKINKNRTIEYDVKAPDIGKEFFRPFDLNKNGPADDADVKATYPDYENPIANLDMSVDNKQGITDKKHIQTLDTNTTTPFSVKFNNEQFGLPTSHISLADGTPGSSLKNENNAYELGVFNQYGYGSDIKTGEFKYTGGNKIDVSGKTSKDQFWQGSVHLDLSADTASLTYSDQEKTGGEAWTFQKGWKGGDFIFKTTKMGTYKLISSGRPWWEMNYEKGKFYTYGVSYNGVIDLNGVGAPTIDGKDYYAKLSSKQMTQPIVKGTFEAKTVGGNIG